MLIYFKAQSKDTASELKKLKARYDAKVKALNELKEGRAPAMKASTLTHKPSQSKIPVVETKSKSSIQRAETMMAATRPTEASSITRTPSMPVSTRPETRNVVTPGEEPKRRPSWIATKPLDLVVKVFEQSETESGAESTYVVGVGSDRVDSSGKVRCYCFGYEQLMDRVIQIHMAAMIQSDADSDDDNTKPSKTVVISGPTDVRRKLKID